jgi:predicted DNA-binding protein (UPF0251 family)
MSMTLDEFRQYYDNHRGVISSVTAYDAACARWASADDLFGKAGAYTLIVVKFKNNTFLRVNVKPSLQVRMGPWTYDSPGAWKARGVDLTYDEKEFLKSIDSQDLTIDELIALVEKSSFEKKGTLVQKLKKASEKMKR